MKTNTALIHGAKYSLVIASALFTALFAAQFAGYTGGALTWGTLATIAAPVAIGLSLDTCKFYFWTLPGGTFRAASLVLLAVSWLASVSYFVERSERSAETVREQSEAFQAHEARIAAKRSRLEQLEALAAANGSSEYHKRRDIAADQSEEADQVAAELASLIEQRATVGADPAAVPGGGLFAAVARLGGFSAEGVRLVAFAAFAALVEAMAVLAISAARCASNPAKPDTQTQERTRRNVPQRSPQPMAEPAEQSATRPATVPLFTAPRLVAIRDAILSGRVDPTHRALKAAGFTNHGERKQVIETLADCGQLVPAARGSWQLAG